MQDLKTFWDYRDPNAYINVETDYHSYVPATLLEKADSGNNGNLVVARQEKMVLMVMTKDGSPYGDFRLWIGLLNDRMDLIEGVMCTRSGESDARGVFLVIRYRQTGPTMVRLCARAAYPEHYCQTYNDPRNALGLYSNLFSNSN